MDDEPPCRCPIAGLFAVDSDQRVSGQREVRAPALLDLDRAHARPPSARRTLAANSEDTRGRSLRPTSYLAAPMSDTPRVARLLLLLPVRRRTGGLRRGCLLVQRVFQAVDPEVADAWEVLARAGDMDHQCVKGRKVLLTAAVVKAAHEQAHQLRLPALMQVPRRGQPGRLEDARVGDRRRAIISAVLDHESDRGLHLPLGELVAYDHAPEPTTRMLLPQATTPCGCQAVRPLPRAYLGAGPQQTAHPSATRTSGATRLHLSVTEWHLMLFNPSGKRSCKRQWEPPIAAPTCTNAVEERGHFLNPRLASYLREYTEARKASDTASITSANSDSLSPTVWRVRDRLTDDQITTLVSRFQAGELQKDLADEYGVSRSTVKRLLVLHDIRRYRPRKRQSRNTSGRST
jgi:hypothetical protein